MITKKFLRNEKHIENVDKALSLVFNAVSSTMGPGGSTVFIERDYMPPLITKDGATVADNIFTDTDLSPVVNLIKHMTKKAALESGDGTTTTTVLTKGMYDIFKFSKKELAIQGKDKEFRRLDLSKYLKSYSSYIVKLLNEKSKNIKTLDELKNIVRVSTNGDEYMTDLIMASLNIDKDEDIDKVKSREIVVSVSKIGKDYLDIVNGSRYDCGYSSSGFCNDKTKTKVEYDNPYVILSADKIYNMKQIIAVLNLAKQDGKPLVIFAPEINQDVLATLVVNKLKMIVDVAVVNTPGFGGISTENYLEDISLLTGANILKSGTEHNFDNIGEKDIGKLTSNIVIEANRTTITSLVKDEELRKRVEQLKDMLDEAANNTILIDSIKKRMYKLSSGITTIYIASETDVETFERKDRLDDAIGSLKSALEDGYVPGAGSTLRFISYILEKEIKKDFEIETIEQKIALDMLEQALRYPERIICENAGYWTKEKELSTYSYEKELRLLDFGMGYNVLNGKLNDLIDEGIIDPTKVLICAIEHSVSLVSALISSGMSILSSNRGKLYE